MAANYYSVRHISSSFVCCGKRNFRKFLLYNKRGTKDFKDHLHKEGICIWDLGVRPTGYKNEKNQFIQVPEMIPELVVPNLKDFKLKPYVSYCVDDIEDEPFTARDLFDAVYSKKIIEDFEKGDLDDYGNSKKPNEIELMSAEKAKIKAKQTGSDIIG